MAGMPHDHGPQPTAPATQDSRTEALRRGDPPPHGLAPRARELGCLVLTVLGGSFLAGVITGLLQ